MRIRRFTYTRIEIIMMYYNDIVEKGVLVTRILGVTPSSGLDRHISTHAQRTDHVATGMSNVYGRVSGNNEHPRSSLRAPQTSLFEGRSPLE